MEKEREKNPNFLVSFWGSIISPLGIQEVSDSLLVFLNSYFCLLFFYRVKGWVWAWVWGCACKGEPGILIRKVSGGIWLAHQWHCELIPQKGPETSMMWTFLARSLPEKLTWSYFHLNLFLVWSLSADPWFFCIYIVTDPLFSLLKAAGSKVNEL